MGAVHHERLPFLAAEASQQRPLTLLLLPGLLLQLSLLDGLARHLARSSSLGAGASLDGGFVQWHTANIEHRGGREEMDDLGVQQALNRLIIDVSDQVTRAQACLKGRAVHRHILKCDKCLSFSCHCHHPLNNKLHI